jgi:hypothetical protein
MYTSIEKDPSKCRNEVYLAQQKDAESMDFVQSNSNEGVAHFLIRTV